MFTQKEIYQKVKGFLAIKVLFEILLAVWCIGIVSPFYVSQRSWVHGAIFFSLR